MINIHTQPYNLLTTENDWWFIYGEDNRIVVEPRQCSGSICSPHTMVVADTLEELEQYITDNELISRPNIEDLYQL